MYETYLFYNFLVFMALTIPLLVADGLFVYHLKHRYHEAWISLGRPGFLLSPRTTGMIRGFVKRGGHPILEDPYIQRITQIQKILAPLQSIAFASFIVLFVVMIASK